MLYRSQSFSSISKVLCNSTYLVIIRLFSSVQNEVPSTPFVLKCSIPTDACVLLSYKSKVIWASFFHTSFTDLLLSTLIFQLKCNDDLKFCVNSASGIFNKTKCFSTYAKCLYNKGNLPVPPQNDEADNKATVPTRHPYVV